MTVALIIYAFLATLGVLLGLIFLMCDISDKRLFPREYYENIRMDAKIMAKSIIWPVMLLVGLVWLAKEIHKAFVMEPR